MDSTEIFKCVAVGDEKSGTTRMIMSLVGGSFSNEYIPTMFETYSLSYNDNCTIDIWDTGGMDSNDKVRTLSYSQLGRPSRSESEDMILECDDLYIYIYI